MTQAAAISYDPPILHFLIDGHVAAARPLTELCRMIAFEYGSPLYSNDGIFLLLDFSETFWIVPDGVGLPKHQDLIAHLQQNCGYFKADIAWHPKRWRAGGIFGMLQTPGPRVVAAEHLPAVDLPWQLYGPMAPTEASRMLL